MAGILFYNAESAVNWAEEWTTRPVLESQFSKMLRAPGGGNVPYSDLIDAARTISLITAECKPFKGELLKLVYGNCHSRRLVEMGEMLAGRLAKTQPGASKDAVQLVRLGVAAVKEMRSRKLYGRKYPLRLLAQDIGIHRSTLAQSKSWPVLIAQARGMTRFMVNSASVEVEGELHMRGWLA